MYNNGMEKKKNGRPSKFETINMKALEIMLKKGFTDKEVCEAFSITEQTLANYKQANPKFFESLKDWKATADNEVEQSLFKRATGFEAPDGRYYPPETTAGIFWLKNRQKEKWRDKVEVNHESEGGTMTPQTTIIFTSSDEDD